MKTFTIKSNYEYEIEAKNEDEAIEKWQENIEDELASENKDLLNELVDSLFAVEEKEGGKNGI